MKIFLTGEAGLIAKRLDDLYGKDVVWGYTHRDLSICKFDSV